MKKIVFVAHEFGLFPGHGGVAGYLYILVSEILERHSDFEIYVIATKYDEKCPLLKSKRLHVKKIVEGSAHVQGNFVLSQLVKIKPDYVESTDYISLCLESIVYRLESDRNELSDTVFITLHHTASRECFEWNDMIPVKYAPPYVQECFARERTQMKLSDLNVAPSEFMNSYVTKNYGLNNVVTILHPNMLNKTKKKAALRIVEENYDITPYKGKFIVNCISRIEGRKNQKYLVQQFTQFVKKTNADALLFIIGNSSINSVTNRDFRVEINESIDPEYRNRILFFDFLGEKGKMQMLALSDVSVLASTFECLSLAMTESVAQEVPVICSKYCGFADYMSDSRSFMTFDPFKENDLCSKLIGYYSMSKNEKSSIISQQIEGLEKLSSFEYTVDDRLALYEKSRRFGEKNNHSEYALVVDETNYLETVTDSIVNSGYNCIIVDFFFNKSNINSVEKWFYNAAPNFSDGEIICYGGDSVKQCYINILLDWIPFFIKGIDFSKYIGEPFVNVIKHYASSSTIVYSLVDKYGGLADVCVSPPTQIIIEKRNNFMKELISSAFYNENLLNMEDKYK